jgi:hypothetical protein
MKAKFGTRDPDIVGSLPAMRRAAKRAKRLAIETNTPLWVMVKGTIVNINPSAKPTAKQKGRAKPTRKK